MVKAFVCQDDEKLVHRHAASCWSWSLPWFLELYGKVVDPSEWLGSRKLIAAEGLYVDNVTKDF
jgi:3-methyladenine DNA glycosylase AlkC